MAPGPRFHKYNVDDLKRDLKHHLKLELSFNHVMKRIEVEILWKDDPDVPDYLEKPEVIARDGMFVDVLKPEETMSDAEENIIWQQIQGVDKDTL